MRDEILEREYYENLIEQGVDETTAEIVTAEAGEAGAFDA